MRTVYVQEDEFGEWLTPACFASQRGFGRKGYEVVPFYFADLKDGKFKLTTNNIVHGSVQAVVEAWRQMGIARPKNIDLPDQLRRPEYIRRKVWDSTLAEARKLERPIFIKPLEGHKAFTGHVVRCFSDLIKTAAFDSNYPVLAQEPVTFLSEFRVFVLRGRAIGCSHYWGKPTRFPDGDFVEEMIAAFTEAPAAYSIDVGIMAIGEAGDTKEETGLIEVNDAFALGSYGLDAMMYVQMVEARWDEVVQEGKK